ncbi:hypothetical protein KP509_04G009600 [Ceratopteris richardii]|uniref:Uncharacterized protein n=1 Tax=Ceratopteris richardii TaxID=49495 RepID=A0A8T2UU87_CERRI|nr:hypothetical protein KP509_04G009600 [Ceratopteris richardii]
MKRDNPQMHKRLIRIGCGAGFAGDRPVSALRLLKMVPDMDYLVLECLAERTLAMRYEAFMAGGKGYDPRISEWMHLLLPEAVIRNVCIITNMGAVDVEGAQDVVLKVAEECQVRVSVGIISEVFLDCMGSKSGSSTYLGAAPIVKLLETSKPNVILTSRLADASLFLAPMVYELGWSWDDFGKLAQGALAGHLLECGCQVTGGYFAHPADVYRDLSAEELINISLPYADISENGEVVIAKPESSGGELSALTCGQQLLYEVGDPSCYVTPDVIVDFTNVMFEPLNEHQVRAKGAMPSHLLCPKSLLRLVPQDSGWKAWGEISYGGVDCIRRAELAEIMVRAWMEEMFPHSNDRILGYLIGVNSLLIAPNELSKSTQALEVRLRMDGLFDSEEQAMQLMRDFEALYTNGPAGGGGISLGCKKETTLKKILVPREETFWKASSREGGHIITYHENALISPVLKPSSKMPISVPQNISTKKSKTPVSAVGGIHIPLHEVAHCRAGDKGNDINFSLIPHCSMDLLRLQSVITKDWVKRVIRPLFHHLPTVYQCDQIGSEKRVDVETLDNIHVEIYVVQGIHALNIVVRDALDGGVTCSRRIDRHGKSLSDLIICQTVKLPI